MAGKRRISRALFRRAGALHVGLYRRSGGKRGGVIQGAPVMLITTTGRVTGQDRTQPICYGRAGQSFIVVGSNGGSKHPPMWPLNLAADPAARVQIGDATIPVRGHEVVGDEYDRYWSELTHQYPVFLKYPKKTSRHLPVWVLDPVTAVRPVTQPS